MNNEFVLYESLLEHLTELHTLAHMNNGIVKFEFLNSGIIDIYFLERSDMFKKIFLCNSYHFDEAVYFSIKELVEMLMEFD